MFRWKEKIRGLAAALALLLPGAGAAQDRAGDFDHYVLALSWQPSWCAREGAARAAPACERPEGWVLHGLWPQHARGWPAWCESALPDPSRAETGAMADIMGSGASAWHQWKKHGRCSGLAQGDYFALSRAAYASVTRPEVFARLDRAVRLPARVIEEAFLEANPQLEAEGVTVTCKAGRVAEVRICLTRDLAPRPCGTDTRRDCALTDALLDPPG